MTRTAFVVVTACAMALPAGAATGPDDDVVLENIIVTATRTGETALEKTPMAITVHGAEDLNEFGVEEVEDLVRFTPGLNISENSNLPQIYIRGVGTNNVFVGSDPSTPIHVDGVYIARPVASVFDMLNVERVEVLKGPQGTLYGRNATGGTINVISHLPGNEVNHWASVDVGSFEKLRVRLHSGGPLVQDALYGNIEILRHVREGYVDNINPDGKDDLSNENRLGTAGTLRWRLGGATEFIVKGDYFEMDEAGTSFKPTYLNRDGSVPQGGTQGTVIEDYHTLSVPFEPNVDTRQGGVLGKIVTDLANNLTFTSLTAYRKLDADLILDVDWSDAEAVPIPNPITSLDEQQDQWSQEFQLNGAHAGVTWVAGLYYFQEDHDSDLRPNATVNSVDSALTSRSYAAFGNGRLQLSDRLGLSAGARYNRDEKDFDSDVTLGGNFFGTVTEDDSWNAFLPRAGVDFQWTDDTLLYGSVSKGYKSGGYNPTSFPFPPFSTSSDAFEPEVLWAYETGVKQDLIGKRLRLHTALFYYDYQDIQIQNFLGAGMVEIANAGDAESYGGEIETVWRATRNWTVDLGLSYQHTEFQDGATAQGVLLAEKAPIAGNTTPVTPEWTANIGITYDQYLSSGSIRYRLNAYQQAREYYSALNDDVNSQDTYSVIGARVGYLTSSQRWEISLYGDNLTDTDYASAGADFNNRGVIRSINPPRTIGLQLIWRAL